LGRQPVKRQGAAGVDHLPFLHAGTEVVEFSPTDNLKQTMDVINKNMESSS
jgi:hypothetical protein